MRPSETGGRNERWDEQIRDRDEDLLVDEIISECTDERIIRKATYMTCK